MTLSTEHFNILRNHYSYGFEPPKLGLFPAITRSDIDAIGYTDGGVLSTLFRPAVLLSPPYSIVTPGESVDLYAGDSFERGGAAATGHTWSLVSGSASLNAAGTTCTVTPTGGENSYVTVRCTAYDTSSNSNYRDAHILASTHGWQPGAVQRFSFEGSFERSGWEGELVVAGHESDYSDLDNGKLLLFHMVPRFNGQPYYIGGYKRAQNLCLLRIKDWHYNKGDHTVSIALESPAASLNRAKYQQIYSSEDGDPGALQYLKTATPTTDQFTISDLRFSDALLHLVSSANQPASRFYNVTIAHDQYEYDWFRVNIGPAWQQLQDICHSMLGIAFCNFTGSLQMTPHRIIRGDEWWTPTGIWDATLGDGPLTRENAYDDTLGWQVNYHDAAFYRQAKIVGQYFENGLPREAAIMSQINEDGEEDFYVLTGIYIPTSSAANDWANDALAMANREWDLMLTMNGSNVLNVGDTLDVQLTPGPDGLTALDDTGWVRAVRHNVDLTGPYPSWLTTYEIWQVTTA